MATAQPNEPSKNALCSIAACLKLAKTDSNLPDEFITDETTLVAGNEYCTSRKSEDSKCVCDEGSLKLSTYKRDAWVSQDICDYIKKDYIPYLQSQVTGSEQLVAAAGYRCYESIVCETVETNDIQSGDVECGAELSEWDNMKTAAEENYADIKDKLSKWKTKAMDQYLLNTDVYLYDFANRESKAGKGPFQCRMLDGNPCCIPDEIWKRQNPQHSQVKKIIDTFIDKKGKNRKNIPCKDHFGVQHDYGNGLENQCRHRNDEGVECEGKT